MQVKEIMTAAVERIDQTTTINEAARMMRDSGIGILPVAQDDRLVGMITDRDIVVRAIAEGRDPTTTPVGETMSDAVLYCFEDQSLDEVAENLGKNQIRRLPVLNRDKRLIGIVSLGDLSSGGAVTEAGDALNGISKAAS